MADSKIIRAIKNWWALILTEPTELGGQPEGRMIRAHETGYTPTTAAPGRMMFPAQAWSVPKDGPNAQGESRAVQLYPKLVDYEWVVLLDAAGIKTPNWQVIAGAAVGQAGEFLRSAGALDLMGKPTDLGRQLIAMRQRRVDVV